MAVQEPRWRRHGGTFVGSLPDDRYGTVDFYLTPATRTADGDIIVRFENGPDDFLRLAINDYVANWETTSDLFDMAFWTATDLGLYNDTLH
jgi:hypothetical protein